MAVNTPTKNRKGKGFAADLTNVEACAKRIALKSSDKINIEKSTLPVRQQRKSKQF